jgi:hypothetical protein
VNPAGDNRMIDMDAMLGHHFFEIAMTQAIA